MENYEFVKDIGAGSFGLAKLMRNKTTKELVAMKFIERGHRTNENVAKEIINHRSLRHPNIVRFKEVLLTRTHLVIVMEFAAGGELYERTLDAGRFSEDEARYFFQQLISGVSYCHFMQISHGDLKLANTLLDGSPAPRLKICDFGYSTSDLLHSKPKSIAGTLRYIAPEVLSGTEYDGKLADVWSCGVTLYVMLFGAYPFEDEKEPENFEKTTQRILGAQYEIPAYVHISEECRQLFSHMFVAPARRTTIEEIKKHPWFLKNLPRELTAAAQAIYYNRSSPAFSLQSVEDIMEIVTEAAKPAINPTPVSNSIGGFRWAKEENDDDQEENVELEVDKEQEYEVAEEDEYDKIVKEVYEDKRVKEVYKSKSLSVFDVVRSAERSLVLNQFHSDYTDPSPLAATSFDQSMVGLRLAERSVCYPEKPTNSKLLDSSMYVRSVERSISASQSLSFEGSSTNTKLSNLSISDVRSSEKSIMSNVSHPSKPSAFQRHPSMSDVRPAEKSVVLNQLHSYHFDPSASKLHTEGSIDSKALDSDYLAQTGNFDLSISDVVQQKSP